MQLQLSAWTLQGHAVTRHHPRRLGPVQLWVDLLLPTLQLLAQLVTWMRAAAGASSICMSQQMWTAQALKVQVGGHPHDSWALP